MRRFLIIAVALIVCVGCHNLDKEVDKQPDNLPQTELQVDKSELILDYTAQSVDITIIANQPFSVEVDVAWITYTIVESGDRVVLSVAENSGSEPRSAEVVISAGDLSHRVKVEQGVKPETMQLIVGHTSLSLDSPTWGGSDVRGVVDWGDGTTEEYYEGISHDYADADKRSAQFTMEGATSFRIERVGEIESVILAL